MVIIMVIINNFCFCHTAGYRQVCIMTWPSLGGCVGVRSLPKIRQLWVSSTKRKYFWENMKLVGVRTLKKKKKWSRYLMPSGSTYNWAMHHQSPESRLPAELPRDITWARVGPICASFRRDGRLTRLKRRLDLVESVFVYSFLFSCEGGRADIDRGSYGILLGDAYLRDLRVGSTMGFGRRVLRHGCQRFPGENFVVFFVRSAVLYSSSSFWIPYTRPVLVSANGTLSANSTLSANGILSTNGTLADNIC